MEFSDTNTEILCGLPPKDIIRIGISLNEEITIELKPKAKEKLVNLGYDPVYGARPLKRVMQKQILDKLALMMIKEQISPGGTVEVNSKEGDIILKTSGVKALIKK